MKRSMGAVLVVSMAALLILAIPWTESFWIFSYFMSTDRSSRAPIASRFPDCPGCNLILISLDTLRADHLGFMGANFVRTPNLDEIASRSQVFDSAYTNAYYTTPSHMSVFTSLYPTTHRIDSGRVRLTTLDDSNFSGDEVEFSQDAPPVPLNKSYRTLAEILLANGYQTHWAAPLRLKYLRRVDGFGRGFQTFRASPFARGFAVGNYKPKNFDVSALEPLLRPAANPHFIFLHSYVVHAPYAFYNNEPQPPKSRIPYGSELMRKFRRRIEDRPHVLLTQRDERPKDTGEQASILKACSNYENLSACFHKMGLDAFWHAVGQYQALRAIRVLRGGVETDEERKELEDFHRAYISGVEDEDRQMGQLWRELEKSRLLEKSIVVIFSDHGEEFLEHGKTSHSDFFEHTARVPLVVYHPKMKGGVRYGQLISLVDVMPMVLDTLGIPRPAQAEGHAPWHRRAEYVFGQTLGWDYVVGHGWKLIRDRLGQERLYYLPTDPGETNDLISYSNRWVTSAYQALKDARERMNLEQAL